MIEIDGSFGEGGGQILRTALSLSVISQKPFHIFNIRKGRKNPGLKNQHLFAIRAMKEFSSGEVKGDFLGSEQIFFYPGRKINPKITIHLSTAASITLILQTLILPALFSKKEVEIYFQGGATDTFFSPSLDHFRFVFLKIIKKMMEDEEKVVLEIKKRGYYPEGGAEIKVKVFPLQERLNPLFLKERGALEKIVILSGASESLRKRKVAERQVAGVKEVLGRLKLPLKEEIQYYPTKSPGSNLSLIAHFENTILGVDNLGKLGKKAEEIGKEAAFSLLKEEQSKACLDKHLADQILPFLSLAEGKSQVSVSEITQHCRTNMWVIGKFFKGRFEIKNSLITWIPQNSKHSPK